RPFDRIGLQKAIQFGLVSPAAFEVVVADVTGVEVADRGIAPVRELHSQPGCGSTVEPHRALGWWWQLQPPAGHLDRRSIAYFRSDCDDVRHTSSSQVNEHRIKKRSL